MLFEAGMRAGMAGIIGMMADGVTGICLLPSLSRRQLTDSCSATQVNTCDEGSEEIRDWQLIHLGELEMKVDFCILIIALL